jgi:hypothetical protein
MNRFAESCAPRPAAVCFMSFGSPRLRRGQIWPSPPAVMNRRVEPARSVSNRCAFNSTGTTYNGI